MGSLSNSQQQAIITLLEKHGHLREQHDMPFQLSTGVNLESGFINIEKVTQKHIKILLAEKSLIHFGQMTISTE